MKRTIHILFSACLNMAGLTATAQTWWQQSSGTTENLMNINFYDNNNGMAFGDTLSRIVKTTNQGATWNGITPSFSTGDIRSSAFLDANTVMAVGVNDLLGGNGVILKTTNNGTSWTTNTSIPEKLFDISFVNSLNGWISGENGYIARSTDGGSNWTQLTTGTGEDIFSVFFINANEGWAVGTVDSMAVILHTTNSGTNWNRQSSNIITPLFSIFFTDNLNGWAVGESGEVLVTNDGGSTWLSQTSGSVNDLFDVYFLDANKGWVVGGGGIVLKTINGGTSWTSETSGTGNDINSITMRNDSLGWFCGDGGVIFVYGNNPPSSINETVRKMSQLQAFPNPATEQIKISITEHKGKWSIELYDTTGKLVRDETVINGSFVILDRRELKTGLYMLMAKDNDGNIHTQRIIFK